MFSFIDCTFGVIAKKSLHNKSYKKYFLCFILQDVSLCFEVYMVLMKSLSSFLYMVWVKGLSSFLAYGYPFVSAPSAEKTAPFILVSVKSHLTVKVTFYFWTLCLHWLICLNLGQYRIVLVIIVILLKL